MLTFRTDKEFQLLRHKLMPGPLRYAYY
jgi:hypothetical protein